MSAPVNITRWKTSVSKLSKSQLIRNSNSRIGKFVMHSQEMGLKNHYHKPPSSSSPSFSIKPSTILTPMLFLASLIYFLGPTRSYWAWALFGPDSAFLNRSAKHPAAETTSRLTAKTLINPSRTPWTQILTSLTNSQLNVYRASICIIDAQ